MKKLASIILALTLVMGMSTVAFAAEDPAVNTNTDMETITITKDYEETNTGTTSPAETFNFTIENASVTDAASGITKENMPEATIGSVVYVAGDAGSVNKSKQITVTLPEYTSVGIYTYTIKETAGTTAGVTYYGDDIELVVTVQQIGDKLVRVAAVHTEASGAKTDNFSNIYSAGTLAVSKTVTGNMGDQKKDFTVTVEFTAPTGKTVNEDITYVDGTETKTIASTAWNDGKATAEITLKHNETVTFTNIPYGVTYTVVENDYKEDGYDEPVYTWSDETNKKIDSASDTVGITNNKGVEVDTGIGMDSLPYMLLLAFAFAGMVVFFAKKRFSRAN